MSAWGRVSALGGVCSGGVCLGGCLPWGVSAPRGVSAPGGCLLQWVSACSRGVCLGVSAPGGVSSGGCLLWGVSATGGSAPGGAGGCLLLGGFCIPACTEADTPLLTESQTPVKHYLGPTSLRSVKMYNFTLFCNNTKITKGGFIFVEVGTKGYHMSKVTVVTLISGHRHVASEGKMKIIKIS